MVKSLGYYIKINYQNILNIYDYIYLEIDHKKIENFKLIGKINVDIRLTINSYKN